MGDIIPLGSTATTPNSNKLVDTAFARASSLTEEHFCFIIHHAVQGVACADIVTLLNDTFSLQEDTFVVGETLAYIRRNVQREQYLLRQVTKYAWCPTQPPANSNTRPSTDTGLGGGRKFTDEMKAFMLWRYELGHQKLNILNSLNAQFETQFNITSVKHFLSNMVKNSKTTEALGQLAPSFSWWKPPPTPESPEGVRAAKQARVRAARKRHAERSQVQKQWVNGHGKSEMEQLQL